MDAERIAAIKERVEEALRGPWRWVDDGSGMLIGPDYDEWGLIGYDQERRPFVVIAHCGQGEPYLEVHLGSAAFIAHARQDVPDLLAEVERLRESFREIERLYLEEAGTTPRDYYHVARDALAGRAIS